LEKSDNFTGGTKAKLLALMMQHLPAAPPEPPKPAPEPPGTEQGIEVLHPLELKLPPRHDPPAKTFSL
jgi:hypothetical protein